MRLNLKLIAVCASVFLIAACSSKPDDTQVVTSTNTVSGPLAGSQEDLEATAGHRVFFGFDAFQLDSEAQETLRRQAAWLSANPAVGVLVSGNADERGTREYNIALGARRANAAKDFLVSLGVDPSRISTISYGEERPIALGSNEQSWALNRNATTLVQTGPAS
ncbi:MAG: peptidoglycan-associated lipoprotein Pal [Pseudomonadota bacterium]